MAERTISIRLRAMTEQFETAMTRASQRTRQLTNSTLQAAHQNQQAFTALGLAGVAVGGAITVGMSRAADASMEFESSLTKINTLVGVSKNQVSEWGDQILRLGPEVGRGPLELADAMFFVTSAGLRGSEALDALEASAKASAVGLGETKVVADLVTSAMNAYGADTLDAATATDVLIGAVREGKAEAPALAGAMGRVLPVAAEMGVSFDQVGAAVAAMTRTGTDAATATTQLRAMLVGLLKPAQQSEQAMAELGLSSAQLRRQVREGGLLSALQTLRDRIGDNDEVMQRIFPNVRALSGVLDIMGANAEENAAIFERMTNTVGLLDDAFEGWSNTNEAAMARFNAAAQSVQVMIGDTSAGVKGFLAGPGAAILTWFMDLSPAARGAAAAVLGIVGVSALLGGSLLLLLPRIQAVNLALAQLAATSPRAAAGMGMVARAAGGLAALGVAAIAVNELARSIHNLGQQRLPEVDSLVVSLQRFADEGEIAGEMARAFGSDLSGIGAGMRELDRLDGSAVRRFANHLLESTRIVENVDAGRMAQEFERLDEALGQLMQVDPDAAVRAFNALSDALRKQGVDVADLIVRLPTYQRLLDDAIISGAFDGADATDALSSALDEMGTGLEDTTTRLQRHMDAIRGAMSPVSDVQSALLRVSDAEQRIADIRSRSNAREVEMAQRRLADAGLSVADAQERVARAEERIHEIRTRDNTRTLLEAELGLEESTLNLVDAENRYNEALAEHGPEAHETRRAAIALERSRLSLADAQDRLNDAQADDRSKELADANRDLQSAKRGLDSALTNQRDAQRDLNEATGEGVDKARELEQAERDLFDAKFNLAIATLALRDAMQEGETSMGQLDRMLDGFVRNGVYTSEQADKIRDSFREAFEAANEFAGLGQIDVEARARITLEVGDPRLPQPQARRQHGGPVWPGLTALVGEEGPELVRFGAHGSVVPHRESMQALSVASGGSRVVHHTRKIDQHFQGLDPVVAMDVARRHEQWNLALTGARP